MKRMMILLVFTSLLLLVDGCKKEDNIIPTVKVIGITNITATSAMSGGDIIANGGSSITEFGLCLSTAPNPMKKNVISGAYLGSGTFTLGLKGLAGDTKYYVRAYATNSAGTGYSEEVSFQTLSGTTVADIDGNVYNLVQVGNQTWLAQNLITTKYRNGDPIPLVSDNNTWSSTSTGAMCWYNNSSDYKSNGTLYNWYAATDARNIAPAGFHLPTSAEWQTLLNAIYKDKLTNDFTFFYGGNREVTGVMGLIYGWDSSNGNWRTGGAWTATPGTKGGAMAATYKDLGSWSIIEAAPGAGYNIRCIKDAN